MSADDKLDDDTPIGTPGEGEPGSAASEEEAGPTATGDAAPDAATGRPSWRHRVRASGSLVAGRRSRLVGAALALLLLGGAGGFALEALLEHGAHGGGGGEHGRRHEVADRRGSEHVQDSKQ